MGDKIPRMRLITEDGDRLGYVPENTMPDN